MNTTTHTTPAAQHIAKEIAGYRKFIDQMLNEFAPEMLEKARTGETPRARTYWASGVCQCREVLWNAMGKLADLDGIQDGERAEWVGIIDGMVGTAAQHAGMAVEALEEIDPNTVPKP